MMNSKILSIGNEILIGQIENSNSANIASLLYKSGIPVEKMTTIGDVEEDILLELEDSVKKFDITVITGGLGPTHDDLTKPALVKFFNDELVFNEEVFKQIKEIFLLRKIEMPEINKVQAEVPSKCKVIPNSNGTAPGMWFEPDGKIIVSLPGVPYEMKEMMNSFVLPELKNYFRDKIRFVFRSKTLITTGLSESALYEVIGDQHKLLKENKLAYLPSATGVRLRIDVKAKTNEEADNELFYIAENLREKLGKYYIGEGDENVEVIIGNLLRERNMNFSVAESCTGGMISERIVSVAGSSDYYNGGVCTYSDEAKINLLGVDEISLKQFGAVSEQVAIEMAEMVRKKMNSDVSISTTGIAGPSGGSEAKPVGLVWIGFADLNKSYAKNFFFGNNRQRTIERASQAALNILRLELLNQP